MGGIGNNEPDLPFIDLYDSAASVAPANTTRIRRSGSFLQVSTDGGAYQTITTGVPGANNILNIDEPPLPFLDIQDGAEPVAPVNRSRIIRLSGNISVSVDGGAYATLATGVPGLGDIVPRLQPMELIDVWDSGAPVAPTNTMRIARKAGILMLSTDCGAYAAIGVAPPGAPSFWFEADNVDGLGNTSMVDGQQVGTWKNLGSLGAAGDALQATAGLRPLYRAVAAPGKINNKPGVEGNGTTQYMSTAAVAAFTQPSLIAIVARSNTIPAVEFMVDGRFGGGTARQTLLSQTGTMQMASNSIVNIGTIQAAKFHSINANFNGASSQGRVDGVAGAVVNPGTFALDGVTLFASNAPSGFLGGFISLYLGYTGGSQPTPAQVEAYITSKYGVTPS